MDAQKIMESVAAILAESGIDIETFVDYVTEGTESEGLEKTTDPIDALREGLVRAKDATGLEYEEIGKLVGGVTGGAVSHWVRGRTNPSRKNRTALFRWLRSVEDALGVDLLPADFAMIYDQDRPRA